MKQIFKIFTAFAIVAGLAFPNFKAVFLPVTAQATQAAQTNAFAAKAITVVSLPKTALIAVAPTVLPESSCQVKVDSTGYLTQDAGVVNLNQSASCFSLRVGTVHVSQVALQVQALNLPQPKILVAEAGPVLSEPNLASSTAPQAFPIIPASASVIFIAAILLERKLKTQTSLLAKAEHRLGLNIFQLQVMRC